MVFGERNSGTNLASELLRRNLPGLHDIPGDRIGEFGFAYGWKHAFPQMIAAPPSTLAVCVFRHPETWVQSMYRRPWHLVPALRDRPFADFLRGEWAARIDETNFGIAPGDPRWGAELHWDRHPLTGKRFANICELRTVKTAGFLSLPNRFANCLLIRHEDVAAAPEAFVETVARWYGLGRASDFTPVTTRRGRAAAEIYRASAYGALEPADRDFLWQQLDATQEARLGYTPG